MRPIPLVLATATFALTLLAPSAASGQAASRARDCETAAPSSGSRCTSANWSSTAGSPACPTGSGRPRRKPTSSSACRRCCRRPPVSSATSCCSLRPGRRSRVAAPSRQRAPSTITGEAGSRGAGRHMVTSVLPALAVGERPRARVAGAPTSTLCQRARALLSSTRHAAAVFAHSGAGISLAEAGSVPEISSPLVYDEPTVMWRMRRAGGLVSHAVLDPRANLLVWFVNDRPLGCRDFSDISSALRWSDQLQAQNWATGWRLAPDDDTADDDAHSR